LLARVTDSIDPGTRALNGLDIKAINYKMHRLDVYAMLKADPNSLLRCERDDGYKLHGHIDGGAQASTTHKRRAIWAFQWMSEKERASIRLKVADDTIHHPEGKGYVKVPLEGNKSKFVRIYYTPTLPVTILSPTAMAKEHGCSGYSSVSFFDGQASSVKLAVLTFSTAADAPKTFASLHACRKA
jgi:hypothetical protein